MAGHNKWSKIKRKKGAADKKRSKIFTRIIKEIQVAVKEGGSGDPDFNPRLRLAIANAKGANMPKDNVKRAIDNALSNDGGGYQELTYEGYAPGGIAVFIECTTDNINRTVSNIRAIFRKREGSLATSGSVGYLFDRKGVFVLEKGDIDSNQLELQLIDAGAEEIETDEEEIQITTAFQDYGNMQDKLEELKIDTQSVQLERLPKTTIKVDLATAKKVMALLEDLEDDDDVNDVFHNMELTSEIEASLNEEEN